MVVLFWHNSFCECTLAGIIGNKVSSVLLCEPYQMPVATVSAMYQQSVSAGVFSFATNARSYYVCYVHIEQYINVNSI